MKVDYLDAYQKKIESQHAKVFSLSFSGVKPRKQADQSYERYQQNQMSINWIYYWISPPPSTY